MPFNEKHTLDELKHYLPTQTPLKDFIHHNTLHAFQDMPFKDAIFKASKLFGYSVTLQLNEYRQLYSIGRISESILEKIIIQEKGTENKVLWKEKLLSAKYEACFEPKIGRIRKNRNDVCKINLDNLVQPLLFRVLASYIDQGISTWKFPTHNNGFLASIIELEKNGITSFFKTKKTRQLLFNTNLSIEYLLTLLVGDPKYFENYLFDQQFSHHGWSGLVATIERQPETLLDYRKISLKDLILFELLLEIDALENMFGNTWKPLNQCVSLPDYNLFEKYELSELDEVLMLWQQAFEWSYYDQILSGIKLSKTRELADNSFKSFHAVFCIDERECSLRRHLESSDERCETFGTPGFFGVEFYFQPQFSVLHDKLCPAPVTPKYLIKEYYSFKKPRHELLYSPRSHSLGFGFLISAILGFFAGYKLISNLFKPKMSPAISNAFTHVDKNSILTIENTRLSDVENGLQIGFTIQEMAVRVENQLRSIGLTKNFSRLIYMVAHGSSSANNPHHGAHDCGACSGKPGSVNARVFSFMANKKQVRELLQQKGIVIPNETQFVGALHDTASDQIEFYDLVILSEENMEEHKKNQLVFERALDLNAKERSRRFASISTTQNIKKIRESIRLRSVSLFEPRPELGHGTNSICVVGRRTLTKKLFLDRRAFLNSYDYRTDLNGAFLVNIMKPLGPVCGGINLEYYFSRVDNHKFGAGTKLPHHVMGLVGVSNSCDGDLRPGLPLQMIEVHDPVRLLIIVEHFPDVVLKTVQSVPEMYEWFINDWVKLSVIHPETNETYIFNNGAFIHYQPEASAINAVNNLESIFETSKKMETNETCDATKENLPLYSIK